MHRKVVFETSILNEKFGDTMRSKTKQTTCCKPYIYNFDKPLLNNNESAAYLNVAPFTLRNSRSTGILLGKPAPRFRKRGRKVIYERTELDRYNDQFPQLQNTSQYKQVDREGI